MVSYLKNKWIRWGSILFLGILFRFLLDVIYSLIYRNYSLLQSFDKYLFTIVITFLFLESIYRVNKILDKKIKWEIKPYKRFIIQWALTLAISLLFAIVIRWIVVLIFISFTYVNLLDEIILIIFVLLITTTATVVDLSIFLLEKWRFSFAELERFKKQNAEFQFESLRAQVNPHFLFNSLNTLSSLIFLDQKKAESFVRELSDVYRYILENKDRELVTLKKELDILKSYVYLILLRFEQNLSVSIDVEKNKDNLLIVPLSLQMLVENATKHNIISKKKPLKVKIYSEDNYIVVSNILQKKEITNYSSKLGLENIKSRYGFMTDNKVEIIESSDEFIVKVPLIKSI
ncbi:MAG: histidine kinase [Bacteroidales bacterium]|nr:histidine kinase [Bacteroidales bacterium]